MIARRKLHIRIRKSEIEHLRADHRCRNHVERIRAQLIHHMRAIDPVVANYQIAQTIER